jgi:glycosyltransferase involved in cell wall biosynthesis
MNQKLKIFYVYYDFLNIMPIHAHEVIIQLAKNGGSIYLFGSINSNAAITKKWQSLDICLIPVLSIPLRLLREISFLSKLFCKLSFFSIKIKPDLIYIRHGSPSLIGTIIGKLFKIPVCIEVNDILVKRNESKEINFIKRSWVILFEKLSFLMADMIFPVTDGIKVWICNNYKVDETAVRTLSNGVNVNRFQAGNIVASRRRYDIPINARVVGYLGSLFHWAGIEYLIDAAPKIISVCPETLFVVGGGGEPYHSILLKKVYDRGLSSYFKFFGFINWDDASDFISTFDISVIPAFFNNLESGISSQKVLAYLACGKPVVGSDIPGLGDMLEREGVGISFPMGDSAALAKGILTLLSDSDRRKHMGKEARKLVVNKCSWEIIVDRMERYFTEIITKCNRKSSWQQLRHP